MQVQLQDSLGAAFSKSTNVQTGQRAETNSGKGSLLLGLAVGLGFQLGHHLPAAG